jgi:hypothetical protein
MKQIAILTALAVLVATGLLSAGFWWGTRTAAAPTTQEVRAFQAGWVNIPWVGPTVPIDQTVGTALPNVGAVYYLDNSTGEWLRYFPGRPAISNLTTLTFAESYLVLLTAPITVPWLSEDLIYDILPSICPLPTGCPDTSGICDLIDDLISGLAPTATPTPTPTPAATPTATGPIVFKGWVAGQPYQDCAWAGLEGGCWWRVAVRIDEVVKLEQPEAFRWEYVPQEVVDVVFPEWEGPAPDVSVGDYVEVSGQESMWLCGLYADCWDFTVWPELFGESNYIRRL